MIISSYNNIHGENARLEVDFDENFFPNGYVVDYNRGVKQRFPATKDGAANARRYYDSITSMCEHRNAPATSAK